VLRITSFVESHDMGQKKSVLWTSFAIQNAPYPVDAMNWWVTFKLVVGELWTSA